MRLGTQVRELVSQTVQHRTRLNRLEGTLAEVEKQHGVTSTRVVADTGRVDRLSARLATLGERVDRVVREVSAWGDRDAGGCDDPSIEALDEGLAELRERVKQLEAASAEPAGDDAEVAVAARVRVATDLLTQRVKDLNVALKRAHAGWTAETKRRRELEDVAGEVTVSAARRVLREDLVHRLAARVARRAAKQPVRVTKSAVESSFGKPERLAMEYLGVKWTHVVARAVTAKWVTEMTDEHGKQFLPAGSVAPPVSRHGATKQTDAGVDDAGVGVVS